jgi:hypothetical protein
MSKSVDFLNTTVDSVKGNLDQSFGWLNDSNTTNLVVLGLVVYAALFVGKIWPKGMDLFKHPLVKIVAFLLVAYLASKNVALALVATIAIVTIMMTNLKNTKEFLTVVPARRLDTDDNVYEAMLGRCVCRCDGRKCDCDCEKDEIKMVNIVPSEEMLPNDVIIPQEHVQQVYVPQEAEKETINERDVMDEMNKIALENIKKQFITHDKDRERGRVVTTYRKGCDGSPYYNETTPMGRPSFLNDYMAETTMDADFENYLNQ